MRCPLAGDLKMGPGLPLEQQPNRCLQGLSRVKVNASNSIEVIAMLLHSHIQFLFRMNDVWQQVGSQPKGMLHPFATTLGPILES